MYIVLPAVVKPGSGKSALARYIAFQLKFCDVPLSVIRIINSCIEEGVPIGALILAGTASAVIFTAS